MLNISAERAAAYTRNVELKVTDVKSLAPAEVNQELFDKIYGEGTVTTAEDFRLKIESELSGMFVKDSDKVFKRDLTESLVKKLKLTLPNEFLKKWILSSSKEEITAEQVEAEYEQYAQKLKWQLVENKIIKDNDIKVDNEEVVALYERNYCLVNMLNMA